MSLNLIVSYDDTANDHDALTLGRVLAEPQRDARITLAYVRHSTLAEPDRERLAEDGAQELLARGARWLDGLEVARRVVLSPSTAAGLRELAVQQQARLVVFGSDYRTTPGHVSPGRSAEPLLDGGPVALAFAPAGYRGGARTEVRRIAALTEGDPAAEETAEALAEGFDAQVGIGGSPDLLVVGSRPEAPEGRVLVSARARRAIEDSRVPVLVLARGVALPLPLPALV